MLRAPFPLRLLGYPAPTPQESPQCSRQTACRADLGCLRVPWSRTKGGGGDGGALRGTSGCREAGARARDARSCFGAALAARRGAEGLTGGGRQGTGWPPAGPARRGALQDWEALPPPSPHGTLPPSIPCFPPHTPSRVCGAAEVMTSPRSPGRRGRINQAEWAVAMARILPLPRRLGICSLCAARVPSP